MPNMMGLNTRQPPVFFAGGLVFGLLLIAVLPPGLKPHNKGLTTPPDLHGNPDFAPNPLKSVPPTPFPTEFSDVYLNNDESRSNARTDWDKVNIIEDLLSIPAESSEQVIAKIADRVAGLKERDSGNAEYLKQLANNIEGMSLPRMRRFLNKEKSKLWAQDTDQENQPISGKYRMFAAAPDKAQQESAPAPIKGFG